MALTAEQKTAIITQRLQQFEAELYQHVLNKATAEALNLPTADSDTAIEQLTTAIGVHQTELELLEPTIIEEVSNA